MQSIKFKPSKPGSSIHVLVLLLCVITQPLTNAAERETISLAGKWKFELDQQDAGLNGSWWGRSLKGNIELPGVVIGHGDGKHYEGPAWFQREIEIPKGWARKRVVVFLERAQQETRLWLDGSVVGTNFSAGTAHLYDLGTGLTPGKHSITLRVDNRSCEMQKPRLASPPPNGLAGRIELQSTDPVYLEDVQVFPNLEKKSVSVRLKIINLTGHSAQGTLSIGGSRFPVAWTSSATQLQKEIPCDRGAKFWDEFTPNMQRLELELKGPEVHDRLSVSYGLRNLATEVDKFLLNSRPIFLRGTVESSAFRGTGFPPTEMGPWKDLMQTCRAYGLNHIRFDAWCPPEAAFSAADELGIYLGVEVGATAQKADGLSQRYRMEETQKILMSYGNHPSFVLLTTSGSKGAAESEASMTDWVTKCRSFDERHLYSFAPARPTLSVNQYNVTRPANDADPSTGENFVFDTAGTASDPNDWLSSRSPRIIHQLGRWCSFPAQDNKLAISAGGTDPATITPNAFERSMKHSGLANDWKNFARSSERFQELCYKGQIEAALRTRGVAGFQLMALRDLFQGSTIPLGVIDLAGKPKNQIGAAQFRGFCNATVVLAKMPKRIWHNDETLTADIEVAHFGSTPLKAARISCLLFNPQNEVIAQGELPPRDIPLGQGNAMGHVVMPLKGLSGAGQYRFVTAIKDSTFQNEYPVWVYPAEVPREPVNVLLITEMDDQVLKLLKLGRKVLWQPRSLPSRHPTISYAPLRWNAVEDTFAGTSLGLVCDSEHPSLSKFPTAFHCDAQWEDVLRGARSIEMSALPAKAKPIVQVIDDWRQNRKLGLIFECRVGKGRLLICGADLDKDLNHRPATRQLRASLLSYMAGADFSPSLTLSQNDVLALLH